MEEWKDIIWFNWLYQISNKWRVKSLKFWRNKILKPHHNIKWYMIIWLSKNSKKRNYILHRLLLKSFIPNLEYKPQVNHINWIKDDNRLENLEWSTASENLKHSFSILWRNPCMEWKFWKDNHLSKAINQFTLQGNFIKTWNSTMDVERELLINHSNISRCCKWKYKFSWWFIWEYKKD